MMSYKTFMAQTQQGWVMSMLDSPWAPTPSFTTYRAQDYSPGEYLSFNLDLNGKYSLYIGHMCLVAD